MSHVSPAPIGALAVLDEHIEDLEHPGSCSCGWELWDGSLEDCRSAYRTHVATHLKEDGARMGALADSVFGYRSLPQVTAACLGGACALCPRVSDAGNSCTCSCHAPSDGRSDVP